MAKALCIFIAITFVYVDLTVVIFGNRNEALIALAALIIEAGICLGIYLKR